VDVFMTTAQLPERGWRHGQTCGVAWYDPVDCCDSQFSTERTKAIPLVA